MSIVFITIPGEQKKEFANLLHEKTKNGIDYVIIQKTRYIPWKERFEKLLKTVGWKGLLTEFYYILYVRLHSEYRNYLKYFFLWTSRSTNKNYLPKVIEVDDVNSKEVQDLLQKIQPKLLVVWGAKILKPRIYNIAENSINLHMGLGEHYRGSVANHFALLENKMNAIGAMVHKIDENTDTGDVYETILADTSLPIKEMFINLNDRAFESLLNISYKLWKGEKLETTPQNLNIGKNLLLREWTPKRRFLVAKKIKELDKK